MMRIITFLVFIIISQTAILAQKTTIIHAGTLLDVPGTSPKTKQSIVIKNNIITNVIGGYVTAKDLNIKQDESVIIDLKDHFVMPGFIDMHTHISQERDPGANPHQWTTLEEADAAFTAVPYAQRTLEAGFTTVRNLGGDPNVMNALKRAIAKNLIVGPRIIAATGTVSPTGGHGDFHGYNHDILHSIGSKVGICNGSDDCRRAVRALVKQGADVIKITATGGVLSNTDAGVGQQLTNDELNAIVATANSLGRKVAAHAHEANGVNAALKAGVHSIEHGSYLNDESIQLFKKTNAYLVPTLLAGVSVKEELDINDKIPPAIADKIRQVAPVVEASFKKALKANVNIAFGTDSGVSKHGLNAREFEIMVQYGMDENEAIKTATVNAATLLGKENLLGTIEKNKLADLVAVKGNPLQDISLLKNVQFVMKNGSVYKNN